jgi:hypothetical protein
VTPEKSGAGDMNRTYQYEHFYQIITLHFSLYPSFCSVLPLNLVMHLNIRHFLSL